MVLTRSGNRTLQIDTTMDLPSQNEGSGSELVMQRAKANKNARQANEIWFHKFADGPTLDNLMNTFDSWNVYLNEVTTEKIAVNY